MYKFILVSFLPVFSQLHSLLLIFNMGTIVKIARNLRTCWKITLSLINHTECIARSRGEWRVRIDGRRRWVDEWGIAVMGKLRKQRAREKRVDRISPVYQITLTQLPIWSCTALIHRNTEYVIRFPLIYSCSISQIGYMITLLLYFPYRSTWFNKIQYKPQVLRYNTGSAIRPKNSCQVGIWANKKLHPRIPDATRLVASQ